MVLSGIFLSCCTVRREDSIIQPIQNTPQTPAVDSSWVSYFDPTSLTVSQGFASASVVGIIKKTDLMEISGIAGSYAEAGAIWVEQDSGNPNSVYLLDRNGDYLGSGSLGKINNRDWEDLSMGPGPQEGVHYLYLAETGDNKQQYSQKYVYRFPEPDFTIGTSPFQITVSGVDIITFSFPDGNKNCEALMVDPWTKDIYLVSKEDAGAILYQLTYPQSTTNPTIARKVGKLPISTVTAADISPDGMEILIKNYQQIFYWKRQKGQSISSVMRQRPLSVPYLVEDKGESICFAPEGNGFYTTSEMATSVVPPVYFYLRKN